MIPWHVLMSARDRLKPGRAVGCDGASAEILAQLPLGVLLCNWRKFASIFVGARRPESWEFNREWDNCKLPLKGKDDMRKDMIY